MPREPDPQLENRIRNAARRLWNKRGEKSLTMRAVAKAAGTTTPTVYERFQDKQDILRALGHQAELRLFAVLQPSRSPGEACQRYLEFALNQPDEYELLFTGLGSRAWHQEPRPAFELMKQSLAARLGGSPEKHTDLALALWSLLHGTATLLVAGKADELFCRHLRHAGLGAFEKLISKEPRRRNSRKRRSTRKR